MPTRRFRGTTGRYAEPVVSTPPWTGQHRPPPPGTLEARWRHDGDTMEGVGSMRAAPYTTWSTANGYAKHTPQRSLPARHSHCLTSSRYTPLRDTERRARGQAYLAQQHNLPTRRDTELGVLGVRRPLHLLDGVVGHFRLLRGALVPALVHNAVSALAQLLLQTVYMSVWSAPHPAPHPRRRDPLIY